MKERYNDTDLREALRRKYSDTPQLPADFMASMKQRMEEPKQAPKSRMLWRWMAVAACLLLIIGIGITLWPKHETQTVQPQVAQKMEQPKADIDAKAEDPQVVEPQTIELQTTKEPQTTQDSQVEPIRVRMQPSVAKAETKTELAKAKTATEPAEEIISDTPPAPETDMAQTLTERDIPITRPENYKYTPEELAI